MDIPEYNYRGTQQTIVQKKMNNEELEAELDFLKNTLKLPVLNRAKGLASTITKIEELKGQQLGNWKDEFIYLCYNSNNSPYRNAELVGVAWSLVIKTRKDDKAKGDHRLSEAVENSKAAYAEAVMMHPEQYAGNSAMAIFMVKALAGWSEAAINEFGTPNDVELEKILEARKSLLNDINNYDREFNLSATNEPLKLTG